MKFRICIKHAVESEDYDKCKQLKYDEIMMMLAGNKSSLWHPTMRMVGVRSQRIVRVKLTLVFDS